MTNGISFGRKSSISVGRISADNAHGTSATIGALSDVAGRIASSIASELKLMGDAGSHQSPGGGNGDPYAIDEIAKELASRLGGNSTDAGQVARALHEFAQESASLIGARPDSRSFEAIDHAIHHALSGTAGAETITSAIAVIEASRIRIKAS